MPPYDNDAHRRIPASVPGRIDDEPSAGYHQSMSPRHTSPHSCQCGAQAGGDGHSVGSCLPAPICATCGLRIGNAALRRHRENVKRKRAEATHAITIKRMRPAGDEHDIKFTAFARHT